jgi:nucleoside-diphosphate-sugar epimerase
MPNQSNTLLVTGATGMLGDYILKELQSRNYNVRALVRPTSQEKAKALGVEVALGDLSDLASVSAATIGVSGIIHAATLESESQAPVDIETEAMRALLESWQDGPFIFISSVDVYGLPKTIPLTESHSLDPTHSYYAQGKIACETLLINHAKKVSRTDYSILRPPNIWAPDPRALRFYVGKPLQNIRANTNVTLFGKEFGDGWIDSRELAWVTAECLTRPLGCAANAVNSHFTWYEVCLELIRLTGSTSTIQFSPITDIKASFAQLWTYDGQLLQEKLGFKPHYHWQEVLAQAIKG